MTCRRCIAEYNTDICTVCDQQLRERDGTVVCHFMDGTRCEGSGEVGRGVRELLRRIKEDNET